MNHYIENVEKRISAAQLAANQANAKLGTGPKTEKGKKTSSQNARRHGFTAQVTVMTEEDRIHHDAFVADLIADFAPVGAEETFLASSAAGEAWRLHGMRAHINNLVSIGHHDGTGDRYETQHPEIHTALTAATVVRDQAKELALLSLYEQRTLRAWEKYRAQLRALQAERKAKRAEELDIARKNSQLNKLQGLPYNPADDGFVFSNTEIDRYTEQYHRARLAKREDLTYAEQFRQRQKPVLPKAA